MTRIYINALDTLKITQFDRVRLRDYIKRNKIEIFCEVYGGLLAITDAHISSEPILEKVLYAIRPISSEEELFLRVHRAHREDLLILISGERQTADISLMSIRRYNAVLAKNLDIHEIYQDYPSKKNWILFCDKNTKTSRQIPFILNNLSSNPDNFIHTIGIQRIYFKEIDFKAFISNKLPHEKQTKVSNKQKAKNILMNRASLEWGKQINENKQPVRVIVMSRALIKFFQDDPICIGQLKSEESVSKWLKAIAPEDAKRGGNLTHEEQVFVIKT